MVKHRVHYKGIDYDCISYWEACEHAKKNWRNSDGAVVGGSYFVKLSIDDPASFVRLVHIRVDDNGLARLHYSENVDDEIEEVNA